MLFLFVEFWCVSLFQCNKWSQLDLFDKFHFGNIKLWGDYTRKTSINAKSIIMTKRNQSVGAFN